MGRVMFVRKKSTDWPLLAATVVAASIFYGDIWIGVTVPLAVVLSIFLIGQMLSLHYLRIPSGFWLLSGLSLVVVLQSTLGHPPRGRSDLISYLPIIYGGWFVLLFAQVELPVSKFSKALMAGAAVSGILMAGTLWFAPEDFSWVRSQHIPSAAEIVASPSVDGVGGSAARIPRLNSSQFAPTTDAQTDEMYAEKANVRNALGFSNYIAAFMVVSFILALFSPHKWATILFATLTLMTLSRFGLVFLAVAIFIKLASNWVRIHVLSIGLIASVATCIVLLIASSDYIANYPQLASLTARVNYWKSAFPILDMTHLFGSPRSYLADTIGATVYWNPHNSVLWLWALFGIGSTLYWAYIFVCFRSVLLASKSNSWWRGIFAALSILLAWSLVEPIVLTPAFELLAASCYGLSSQQLRSEKCHFG